MCKSGHIQKFEQDGITFNFVGIGRIGDRKGRTTGAYIQEYERKIIRRLLKSKEVFDILITHDKDDQSQRGYGMPEISEVLDNKIFQYHFYGHTGEPFNIETHSNSITQSCKVKELEFEKSGVLPNGCMVILEKLDESTFNFEVVETDITNQLTKFNWKY